MAITVNPDGTTNHFRRYKRSQEGQATERLVKELLKTDYNLRPSTSKEDMSLDIDFYMSWQGEDNVAFSLKDESRSPAYASKRSGYVPDIYFELKQHRVSPCKHEPLGWVNSWWFNGKATHYMIAWWLEDGQRLELRIYKKSDIRSYLESQVAKGNKRGWDKECVLNSYTQKTQTSEFNGKPKAYDNAKCGYIKFDAVPHIVLAYRYNSEGTLEAI